MTWKFFDLLVNLKLILLLLRELVMNFSSGLQVSKSLWRARKLNEYDLIDCQNNSKDRNLCMTTTKKTSHNIILEQHVMTFLWYCVAKTIYHTYSLTQLLCLFIFKAKIPFFLTLSFIVWLIYLLTWPIIQQHL